ncbi:MAG: HEAT repeat domain-containing protein [Polyangiaceae bacterium]|nr:HEAT repeat domain-containing protein [Polyangiaceae bacterium]
MAPRLTRSSPLPTVISACMASVPMLAAGLGLAQPAPPPAAAAAARLPTRAPATAGQRELGIGFVDGVLTAKVCVQPGCSIADGVSISLPPDADPRAAALNVVRIAKDRHVVHVVVPRASHAGTWEGVFAAPLVGTAVRRVFAGETGFIRGQDGLRSGPMVVVSEADAEGVRRVVVGEQREDISLCGRPTVISPELLVPSDLQLKPALVQRLSVAERSAAPKLVARRALADDPPPATGLLRAVAATSAIGDPRALSDGDPETAWAENRTGPGRGEFAVLHAPPTIPLTGLEIVSRPPSTSRPAGSGPKVLWVATERQLFEVTFAEDPFAEAGSRYEVEFPEPVTTDCVALVTDSAFDARPSAEVTIAEVAARSALTGARPESLATRLQGGDANAEAAAGMLRSLGDPGYAAVAQVFASLDEGGRRVALDVMDQAPCALGAPVFVKALRGPYQAQRDHAKVRLLRCGASAGPALIGALDGANHAEVLALEDLLAVVAPAEAVRSLVPRLRGGTAPHRQGLRVELARAAAAPMARTAVLAALADPTLPEDSAVDLVRALGTLLPKFQPAAGRAFARLARREAKLRTRYLLAEATAALAPSDASARAWLSWTIAHDPHPQVRARFAEAIAVPNPFERDLIGALKDESVRVRLAALETLVRGPSPNVARPVAERLRRDSWPMVRAAAATVIAVAPADPELDRVLVAAIRDRSPLVRVPVIVAIGMRRAVDAAPLVRKRLTDRDEDVSVRSAAASALGELCDTAAIEPLTRLARRFADSQDQSADRRVAPAAVAALGKLHPGDLRERLAPLLAKDAPPAAREAAQSALATPARCGAPR